jgi:hypothetical protein
VPAFQEKSPREFFAGAFFRCRVSGILVGVSFALSEILLDLAFELLGATLDVFARIVGCITEVATHLAFHFFGRAFHLILDTTGFEVFSHKSSASKSLVLYRPRFAADPVNAIDVPVIWSTFLCGGTQFDLAGQQKL